MKATNINTQALRTVLFGFVGSIQFKLAPTEIKLRKRDGEQLRALGITKLYKVVDGWRTATIGGRYGDAVRAEETMEAMMNGKTIDPADAFESVGLPRGRKFVQGSVSVMTNTDEDTEYVGMRVTGVDPVYYLDQDGKIWDKADIEFALPARSYSSRQNQENKVIWNTPKIENFRGAIINGKEFKVTKA